MFLCKICQQPLKSKKSNATICKNCTHATIPPENKVCEFCDTSFIDNSRSKNKRYCSKRCNVDAGHARFKDKILSGVKNRPKDTRDRRVRRRYRYNSDIKFKLSITLRTRLNTALKNNNKVGSAVRDLGCSIEEFKRYVESLWQLGMNWDNWSKDGWHIDHIIPLSSFDLTNVEDFKKACHYTNLRPMWAYDNFRKSDKLYNHTVYILAGPNGCGKTTLANKLTHRFNIIDYDIYSFNKCVELAVSNNIVKNLIVTPIQAKRMKRILESYGIKVVTVYLQESRETIVERIMNRGGEITATVDRRIDRYESLKNSGLFSFFGTYNEVYDWLLTN